MFKFAKSLALGLFVLCVCQCTSPEMGISEDDFKNPPVAYRPLAYWDWLNGYVDTAQLVYELEEMKDKGMQGAFIWDVGALIDPDQMVPAGPAFLERESLQNIAVALKTADRLGLNLGLITSSSWNAGGPWVEEAEATKQLLSSTQLVSGPGRREILLDRPKANDSVAETCSVIAVMAIPAKEGKVIDYLAKEVLVLEVPVGNATQISWDVPEGTWEIHAFYMCNTLQKLFVPSPHSDGLHIDHLSRSATKVHFDTITSRLEKMNAPLTALKYLEVDSYELTPANDWTPAFLEEFNRRYGYDPVQYLPLLTGYDAQDSLLAQRFRGDYRRLVSDLIIENHFRQGTEITNQNGMLLYAEAGHGGTSRVDPLKAMGQVDVPMGEFWNRQRHWVTKEAASAAHIYGKSTVASESLTGWMHWQHGPSDYKQLADVAFCEGLNQIVFHTFAHNPKIAGKPGFAYHAGEHINVNATWWGMSRPFMDYLSRCSFLLRQGNPVADVLLYYGDDAPNLVPPKRMDPKYTPDMPGIFPYWFYDERKCPHCGMPKPIDPGHLHGYEYDYINEDVITRSLSVDNGKLTLPHGTTYRFLMLPDRKDISLEVLKSIEQLVFHGAVVIGPKPDRATSLRNYPDNDQQVKALAEKIWGDCDGKNVLSRSYGKGTVYWGKTLEEVLKEQNIRPDVDLQIAENPNRQIDYVHRQTASEDIYFISNSSESTKSFSAVFRVDAGRVPEIWDAETGLIQRDVRYSKEANGIRMEFVLDPLASRFVVFREGKKGENDPGLSYDLQFALQRDQQNAASIDLSSDWRLSFDPNWGGPENHELKTLKSWTESEVEGINYYSGTATYTKDFQVEQEVLSGRPEAFLVFEDIRNIARVRINGNDCGVVWAPPFRVAITPYLKAGNNEVVVEVANTWNNRIVGDYRIPKKAPYTQSNIKSSKFKSTSPLLHSGLIGKAEILFLGSGR